MFVENIARFKNLFKEYTELRIQKNSRTGVSLLNGDIVGNSYGSNEGLSARTYNDGVWGFASSPCITDEDAKHIISKASDNADFLATKEGNKVKNRKPIVLPFCSHSSHNDLSSNKPGVSQKELIDFAKTIDEYCAKHYKDLLSRSVSISCLDMEKNLLTSDGSMAYSLIPRTSVVVSFTINEKEEPIDLYDIYGGLGQFQDLFFKPEDLFQKIDKLYENLKSKTKGVYAKPGIKDVIIDSAVSGILAHEAIGHTVEADGVLGGSIAGNLLIKTIASPLVSLVDFANNYNGNICPVPVWTDDEGTEAKDAIIIENGILKSYMHNKESSAIFETNPTGNARAFGFYDEPLIRMRNTAILPGSSNLQEMINSIDDGYYLLRTSNGQADSTSEFMFGIIFGYEIKNGKLGNAIRDTTISGIAVNVLKSVDAISNDMTWSNGGMCGKKQSIPVGMGGPAIKCKINIGGRE